MQEHQELPSPSGFMIMGGTCFCFVIFWQGLLLYWEMINSWSVCYIFLLEVIYFLSFVLQQRYTEKTVLEQWPAINVLICLYSHSLLFFCSVMHSITQEVVRRLRFSLLFSCLSISQQSMSWLSSTLFSCKRSDIRRNYPNIGEPHILYSKFCLPWNETDVNQKPMCH